MQRNVPMPSTAVIAMDLRSLRLCIPVTVWFNLHATDRHCSLEHHAVGDAI